MNEFLLNERKLFINKFCIRRFISDFLHARVGLFKRLTSNKADKNPSLLLKISLQSLQYSMPSKPRPKNNENIFFNRLQSKLRNISGHL